MEHFTLLSKDKKHTLYGTEWLPSGPVRAQILMIHGMCEYMGRYDETGKWFASQGYLLSGIDLPGHGKSVSNAEELGFFPESVENILADIHQVEVRMKERHPDVPLFLMGHSMGSFLARIYMTVYPDDLRAAVIVGTGDVAPAVCQFGKLVASCMAKFRGWNYRSPMMKKLVMGSYGAHLAPGESPNAWISTRREIVDAYDADPFCTYTFTLNGFHTLMEITKRAFLAQQVPVEMPVFLISGSEDPVGDFGKSLDRLMARYREMGKKNVEMRIMQLDRHEVLGEKDREDVWSSIWKFLEKYRETAA